MINWTSRASPPEWLRGNKIKFLKPWSLEFTQLICCRTLHKWLTHTHTHTYTVALGSKCGFIIHVGLGAQTGLVVMVFAASFSGGVQFHQPVSGSDVCDDGGRAELSEFSAGGVRAGQAGLSWNHLHRLRALRSPHAHPPHEPDGNTL